MKRVIAGTRHVSTVDAAHMDSVQTTVFAEGEGEQR
jgi:hypothetical protein